MANILNLEHWAVSPGGVLSLGLRLGSSLNLGWVISAFLKVRFGGGHSAVVSAFSAAVTALRRQLRRFGDVGKFVIFDD